MKRTMGKSLQFEGTALPERIVSVRSIRMASFASVLWNLKAQRYKVDSTGSVYPDGIMDSDEVQARRKGRRL